MTLSFLPFSSSPFTKKGVAFAIAAAIAHALVSVFILKYFSGIVGESVVWIPAGIGLGMLLVLGVQYWPFLFVGAALGEMGGGHDLLMGMQLAFGSLLGCLAAYFLLARLTLQSKFNLHLQSLSDYGRLLGASVVGAVLATTLNIQFLIWAGLLTSENLLMVYAKWFTGDFFGFAFVTPIILILCQSWDPSWGRRKYISFASTFGLAFLIV